MRFALVLAPLALAAVFAVPAFADDAPDTSTISIQGHGEISAAPDTAFVTSGVTTEGKTARDALDANTKAMADLVAALKTAGIDAKDIQTSGFSVQPQYIYSNDKDASGYTRPPVISGYQVANSVNLKVKKLADLGTILDKMVTVGANTISGISFSVADPAALYEQARKAAFADAKTKAETYASAATLALGRIVSINEQNLGAPQQPYMMKAVAMDAARAPVPVEAGQVTYAIDVAVQWELNQDD
jgi:hypothetical protein